MKAFAYRAVTAEGRMQSGRLSARDETELAALLSRKGLELVDAHSRKTPAVLFASAQTHKQKRILCLTLQTLLGAGLTMQEALHTTCASLPEGRVKDALVHIEKDILAGQSVASAFAAQSPLFDSVFLALLSAGEETGDLPATFGRLVIHLEKQAALRATFLRSVRYPAFLFVLAFAVAAFMMNWVVPQIVAFLMDSGIRLPFMTRVLIALADGFAYAGWAAPVFVLLLCSSLWATRRLGQDYARALDTFALRLPVWGALLEKMALARLTGCLSLLLQSGLPLSQAWQAASQTLNNEALREKAQRTHQAMQQGSAFSKAAEGLFPPLVLQLVRIGETGGTLPHILLDVARHSEEEAHEAVRGFLAALEPALTLLVGGLLAWIVLAVLGPVYGALAPLSAGG